MLARSRMGGPWSRAQQIARAFLGRGHEVTLAWGDDGNCIDPVAPTFEIPVPSPLGLPEAIARHTFPLASRLGLMGRKPVHSFEEVLWLTGSLDYRYSCAVVEKLREFIRTWRPDVVYSEFNRPRRRYPVRGQRLAADDRCLCLKSAKISGNSTPAARDGNARPGLVADHP